MTIEPLSVRFTIGTKVIPPKMAKPIPMPKLSMAQEAKHVRDRFNAKWGKFSSNGCEADPNNARSREAAERRVTIAAAIEKLLKSGPLTRSDIMSKLRLTENPAREAMKDLANAGKITIGVRTRAGHLWGLP